MEIIKGDLLTSSGLLVQQVNATTLRPMGLSAALAKAFPNEFYYKLVPPPLRSLGSAHCTGRVVHLCAQKRPGKPRGPDDTPELRLLWFKQALENLTAQRPGAPVALPYGIGCGLAGGNWNVYSEAIEDWALKHGGPITLYRL
jgi:hypothetical protein